VVEVEVDPSVPLSKTDEGTGCAPASQTITPSAGPAGPAKRGGTLARIVHRNQMGRCFLLVKVVATLDGKRLITKTGDDVPHPLAGGKLELYGGPLSPGRHRVAVVLVYRGQGEGWLAHLTQRKFTIRGAYSFALGEGKTMVIDVVTYEKAKTETPLRDRPALRYDIQAMLTR